MILYTLADPRKIARLPSNFDQQAIQYLQGVGPKPNEKLLKEWFTYNEYVGQTVQLEHRRLSGHISESKNPLNTTPKCNWIRKLIREGVKPVIRKIFDITNDLDGAEIDSIEYFRLHGGAQKNISMGGKILDSDMARKMRERSVKKSLTSLKSLNMVSDIQYPFLKDTSMSVANKATLPVDITYLPAGITYDNGKFRVRSLRSVVNVQKEIGRFLTIDEAISALDSFHSNYKKTSTTSNVGSMVMKSQGTLSLTVTDQVRALEDRLNIKEAQLADKESQLDKLENKVRSLQEENKNLKKKEIKEPLIKVPTSNIDNSWVKRTREKLEMSQSEVVRRSEKTISEHHLRDIEHNRCRATEKETNVLNKIFENYRSERLKKLSV